MIKPTEKQMQYLMALRAKHHPNMHIPENLSRDGASKRIKHLIKLSQTPGMKPKYNS